MRRIDALVADNETVLKTSLKNIEVFSQTLATNSQRIDQILAGAEGLLGTETQPGDIAQAARAIKTAAEHLDAHIGEISTGLARFSNSGLRQWEALAVDGRHTLGAIADGAPLVTHEVHTLGEVDKMVRNIDRNPSRLLFGGSSTAPTDDQSPKPKRQ